MQNPGQIRIGINITSISKKFNPTQQIQELKSLNIVKINAYPTGLNQNGHVSLFVSVI